jgi:hypothetical protein
MNISKAWIAYFQLNATRKRIDWSLTPTITPGQTAIILHSLQAWQLAETSDGKNLIRAATKYAGKIDDPGYVQSIALFIKEEQKHGENLGRYLDAIGQKRIGKDWGDTLFRTFRHWNTSMESWTLAVLVVENTAQIFYQSLKDASSCELLRQICTDILTDEAPHIRFQAQRLAIIYGNKTATGKWLRRNFYKLFYFMTSTLVWAAHRKLFRAGGNSFRSFMQKMKHKYRKTMPAPAGNHPAGHNWSLRPQTVYRVGQGSLDGLGTDRN